MKLYLLVPVFKRLKHTSYFLESCGKYINKELSFIIIDDSPSYEHYEFYQNNPSITVLKGTGNLWWGGSINLGLRHLKINFNPKEEDIIIFANNDVIIDQHTWPSIERELQANNTALFHPRVFNQHNEEIKSGAILNSWIPVRTTYPISFEESIKGVDLITGRFLCMTYKTHLNVGGISTNLPHYQGDWDFSLKAKEKGHKTYMVRDSSCNVDESTTGVRYEKGLGLKEFYKALFTEIKSPQNLNYIYQFIRNHNGPLKSRVAILAAFSKFTIKYLYKTLK